MNICVKFRIVMAEDAGLLTVELPGVAGQQADNSTYVAAMNPRLPWAPSIPFKGSDLSKLIDSMNSHWEFQPRTNLF